MRHILGIILLALSTFAYSQTGEKNFIDQNYIEVTGKSEMEVTPDRIYLEILVNEKDFKGKNLADIEKSMMTKLTEIGVDVSKDLSIKDFLSNFKNYWILKSDILLSKEYQLLVYDANTAGKVFTELQKLGISNISIDRTDNSKIEDFRRDVKINAIKSAREKAKSMSQAISQDIGKAIYIKELENNFNISGSLVGKAAGIRIRGNSSIFGTRAPEPDIEFEKIRLEYNVLVRFELK